MSDCWPGCARQLEGLFSPGVLVTARREETPGARGFRAQCEHGTVFWVTLDQPGEGPEDSAPSAAG